MYEPTTFDVLIGTGGELRFNHHGGWFAGVFKTSGEKDRDFLAPCVALRATGERVPGYIVVKNPARDQDRCEYSYNGVNTFEHHYELLLAPNKAPELITHDAHEAGCNAGFCQVMDHFGYWVAASPVRFVLLSVAAVAFVETCGAIGGAASGGLAAGGAALKCMFIIGKNL